MLGNLFADRNAGNTKFGAASVVALHQHANGVAAIFGVKHARRSADTSLEFIADHSGPAAHAAFFHWAGVGSIKSVPGVFGFHMEAVDVVEPAVPGFGDDGQRPEISLHVRTAMVYFPCDDR